jgi:outer membrane immunogenic protein
MKTHILLKLIIISLLAFSSSIFADEKIDWNGFYGSAMIGRDWGSVGMGNGTIAYYAPTQIVGTNSNSFDGLSGSLKLGYNKQFNNNLIGLELGTNYQGSSAKGESSVGYIISGIFYPTNGLQSLAKIKTYETLTARIGHIFNDKTLVYLQGGGAVARIHKSITDITSGGNWLSYDPVEYANNKTELGFLLGLGIEHKLNDKWALRANYEYIDFGDINFKYQALYSGVDLNPITQTNSIHFSNLSAGVSYAF